jgi:gliding motility-associated-like protein
MEHDETHVFSQAGTYFVELTVESDRGCINSIINEVVISDNPISDFTSTMACSGGVFEIVDRSIAQNGSIIVRQWSFDGGNSWNTGDDTLNTVLVGAGWHEIGLVTTNSAGCTDTTYNDVLVLEKPTPSFAVDPACDGIMSELLNTSTYMTGIPVIYNWDLHNGFTSTDEDVTFMFPNSGTYPVTLTVEYIGLDACIDSVTSPAVVWPNPIPNVLAVPELCESNRTFLRDMSAISSGYIAQWVWTFDNGRVSNVQNPVIPYVNAGTYGVNLTVISENGCAASASFANIITVTRTPIAYFTSSPQDINVFNNIVRFHNNSSFADGYLWSFGDGTVSSEYEPEHQFAVGDHEITLIAYNFAGCADTMKVTLSVSDTYSLYVPNTFTPNGDMFNDVFMAKGVNIDEFEMLIFNRWGELIYCTNDLDSGWNGIYEGVPSQIDVYVYRITFRDIFGIRHDLFGSVNLIR